MYRPLGDHVEILFFKCEGDDWTAKNRFRSTSDRISETASLLKFKIIVFRNFKTLSFLINDLDSERSRDCIGF